MLMCLLLPPNMCMNSSQLQLGCGKLGGPLQLRAGIVPSQGHEFQQKCLYVEVMNDAKNQAAMAKQIPQMGVGCQTNCRRTGIYWFVFVSAGLFDCRGHHRWVGRVLQTRSTSAHFKKSVVIPESYPNPHTCFKLSNLGHQKPKFLPKE